MAIRGAYIHCTPDYTPFYVGKGTIKRMNDFYKRNASHEAVVEKYGQENILKGFIECSDDNTALELEVGLIKCFKRMGVELANRNCGGTRGNLGFKHTEETKRKISKAVKGNTFKRGSTVSPEGCLNMSKAAKGKRWYNNGKTTKMCYLDTQPEGFVLGRGKLK